MRSKNADGTTSTTNYEEKAPTPETDSYSSYYQAYQNYAAYPQSAYAQTYYDPSLYSA